MYILCVNTIVFNSEPWSIIYISGSVCFHVMFLLNLWDFIKYIFIILNPTPLFPTPSRLHVPFFIFVSSLCFCLWSLFMFFWKFFLISIFLLELFFSKNGRTTLFFIKLPLCSRTISNNTVKTTNTHWCFSCLYILSTYYCLLRSVHLFVIFSLPFWTFIVFAICA